MDFTLNEEQEIFKSAANSFFKANCDKKVLEELEESDTGHRPELWEKMAELGWMGTIIPEEYGGVGCDLVFLAVLFEEFGRAAMPSPFAGCVAATLAIVQGGTEEQKKKFLPEIATGGLVFTTATDEPEASCNPIFISLKAEKKDNGYKINGTKLFVSYANIADNMLVVARTNGNPGDRNGLTLLIVDPKSQGISLIPMKTLATDNQFQVDFQNVQVPSENIVGPLDNSLPIIKDVFDRIDALRCAEMVGGAHKELEMTAEYTKERMQFDRPIGTFQAVQHRLADMYIDVQGARWTSYQAVWRLGEKLDADKELAMAKLFTGKACQRVAFSAQQLHGGIGVDLDYDLHFYYKRAKAFELKLGYPSMYMKTLEAAFEL
jgi:alkylation response protein AidB-like acyl-CoA dehydrogenase